MASKGIGLLIAGKVPPPGKLKGYKPKGEPDGDEPDGDEGEGEPDDEGEDEAAGASMMQEFMDAMGSKGGDAAEACKALDAYLEARGFVKR